MTTLRVVLDTSVLLSGIAHPASVPGKIMAAWRHGSIEVLLCNYILEELRRVLPKLAHKHQLTGTQIDELLDILSIQAQLIEPQTSTTASTSSELRDPKDQPVLEALQNSQANYLITGDKDLLVLVNKRIVTPAQFWAAHGGM